ncbi:MAG: TonB-dependent receptor [Alphaproteobacteria bacterium]|nr:MAG: TonB-dependent receptor [Alphaproteobacteria bacterium]
MSTRNNRCFAALMMSVSSLALAGTVHAQAAEGQASAKTASAAITEIEEVEVTGSRVVRDGNSSPSPVTVIRTNDLLTVQPGANLADALNVLPVFAGSRGAGSNPSTGGSASGGNGAANQLNLRNLGITRTLVLMDGLRIPPTLFNGAVDVDLVPQMLVKRVDVVTGGASAVYGSDAVSGVVNYVVDHDFEGVKVTASGGVSEYGDARQLDAGVAWGTSLGDRGHFEASYQFHDGNGILRRSDRPYMDLVGIAGAGTEENPFTLYTDLRQKDYPPGGLIMSGPLAGQMFTDGGGLTTFTPGEATGTSALQVGGDGGTWDSSLLQPLQSHQIFARFDYDLTSTTKAHIQFSDNIKTNENYAEYLRYNNITLRADNPYLTAAQQAALGAGGETFRLRKVLSEGESRRQNSVSDSNQWMLNAGLEGTLGEYDWQFDYIHGRTVLDTQVRNNVNNQRLAAALDVVQGANGPVCYASTVNSAYADCVPLNPFGPTSESAAALDYIFGETNYRAVTTMDDVSGSIAGSPLDLWAGPVTAALSGEWRKVGFRADSDATSDDLVDCTDLRYNCSASQSEYFLTLPANPYVSQTVWEVAGEVNIPILRDTAIADEFDINGALRYTSYNTSGDYLTWKLGADWNVNDELRFRGTVSRDIRAPTLYELYSETFVVNVVGTDLLTGVSPTIPSINGGNPDLKAEIGKTKTVGVVWQPTESLSIALDGYEIKVTDAILAVNGGEPVFQEACYESGGTSPYCDLHERPGSYTDTSASNAWTAVYNRLFNISEIKTWGADLEVNYTSELFGRPFNARFLGAYQPHLYFRQPNVTERDQAGAAFGPVGFAATPTVRLVGFVRFSPTERLTVDIMQRWRNAMKIANEGVFADGSNHIDAFGTTSINLTWDAPTDMGDVQVYLNVQNIFDADAPIGAYTGNGTRAGLRDGYAYGDDVRGRYWTLGVSFKM